MNRREGMKIGQALLGGLELERGPDGVGGTAADLLLVVHGRARAAQVGAGRQRASEICGAEYRWSLASGRSGVQP